VNDMQVVFRRLTPQDVSRFQPWYTMRAVKIIGLIVLVTVCLRWITS
jgi:hypothetical protein